MSLSVKNFGGGGSIGAVENLLVPTLGTTTLNGVTCTANGDGTYTLNGTATARCIFKLASPFGIASGTYKLVLTNVYNGGLALTVAKTNYASGEVGYVRTEGVITIDEPITAYVHINVVSGTVIDNITVKPMLTTNLKATYKEFVKRVGGFTNVLTLTKPTTTVSGVTCTNNGDGTYTLNGTASSDGVFTLYADSSGIVSSTGTFKLSGCPKNSGASLQTKNGGSWGRYDTGNGNIVNSPVTQIAIQLVSGTTYNNVVFKPMLTESLLPEYFDFVKGVEGIEPLFDILDCTRMVKGSITLASDNTSGITINHNLGVIPKAVFLMIDDASVPASGSAFYQTGGFAFRYVNTNCYGIGIGGRGSGKYYQSLSITDTSWTTSSLVVKTSNTGYPYKGGFKYNYIIMY